MSKNTQQDLGGGVGQLEASHGAHVRLLVRPAVVGAGEALGTKTALERLLARVAAAVPVQVAALGEGARAEAALERPLFGRRVAQPRPQQRAPLGVPPPTVTADGFPGTRAVAVGVQVARRRRMVRRSRGVVWPRLSCTSAAAASTCLPPTAPADGLTGVQVARRRRGRCVV